MRYRYPELVILVQPKPELLTRINAAGRFSANRMLIELPDEFDFEGLQPEAVTGLGDFVELLAKPVAGVIDAVLGTDLVNCGGCAQRKDDWNGMS